MQSRNVSPRVLPIVAERWSPRSFDGAAMPQDDLDVILEAACLAPSAFNYQPWRFLYSHRDDANWERFLSLLIPFNASWAREASVLIFIVSDCMMMAKGVASPSHSHSFDAGAAWAHLALQATSLGYHTHGMTGVDFDQARTELGIPDTFRVEAAAVVGRIGSPENLPDGLRSREFASGRKAVAAVAAAGGFAALSGA